MSGTCTVTIGSDSWSVALASSYYEVINGLLGYSSLTAGTGMLFDMGASQTIIVTTVGMQFDIDIVFIGENLEVLSKHEAVAPGNQITGYGRYWLEVNSGEAADVNVGDDVSVVCTGVVPVQSENAFESFMSFMVMIVLLVMLGDMSYNMIVKPMAKDVKETWRRR